MVGNVPTLGDDTLCESFEAMKRHLAHTGQVELADTSCRLGRLLTFDAEAEKFPDAPDANRLLSQSRHLFRLIRCKLPQHPANLLTSNNPEENSAISSILNLMVLFPPKVFWK